MRNSGSLDGTGRLGKNAVAHHRADRLGCDQIDATSEHRFEMLLQAHEREQSNRSFELDQYIDIACRPGRVAGDGAKDRQRADAEVKQFSAVIANRFERLVSLHGGNPLLGFRVANLRMFSFYPSELRRATCD